jgi:hypothetical protein
MGAELGTAIIQRQIYLFSKKVGGLVQDPRHHGGSYIFVYPESKFLQRFLEGVKKRKRVSSEKRSRYG